MAHRNDQADGFVLEGESTALTTLLRGMFANRELVPTLARRTFILKYRRASFGIAWAVMLPLVQASVLAFVLSRIVRFDTPISYAVFVYAGMIIWAFFSQGVQAAATSVVDNSAITTRIYFPRALLPLVVVWSAVYGFVAALPVLVSLVLITGDVPGPELVLVVPAVLLIVGCTVGAGLVLSVLHVYFRDVRFLVSAAITPLFYATPVFYPYGAIGGVVKVVNFVNPATGGVQLLRRAVGDTSADLLPVVSGLAWAVVLLGAGALVQARRDRVLADRI